MIGESAGLDLRKDGGEGMPAGSKGMASLIAVWTSTAAPSMSRLKSNCRVIWEDPIEFEEIMESSPAIPVNCRSRGVATADAMVSGLAPGRLAKTEMVGKSTVGMSLTGRARYATTPNKAMASISRLVAIGRRMKIAEMFTSILLRAVVGSCARPPSLPGSELGCPEPAEAGPRRRQFRRAAAPSPPRGLDRVWPR